MSLLGALTPLGKVAHNYKLWLRCVIAYTLAGSVSSVVIGTLVGELGHLTTGKPDRAGMFCFLGFFCLLLAGKEWGLINLKLPQRKRQTEGFWVHQFGFVLAATMWGFDIGLGVATYIIYSGFWVLLALAFIVADPAYAAILMLTYWFGRVLPVWVAPVLTRSVEETMDLPRTILGNRTAYSTLVRFSLLWCGVLAVHRAFNVQPLLVKLLAQR